VFPWFFNEPFTHSSTTTAEYLRNPWNGRSGLIRNNQLKEVLVEDQDRGGGKKAGNGERERERERERAREREREREQEKERRREREIDKERKRETGEERECGRNKEYSAIHHSLTT